MSWLTILRDNFDTDLFTDVGSGFGVDIVDSRLEYSNNRNTANDLSYRNISLGSGDSFKVKFKVNILTGVANAVVFFGVSDTALQYTSTANGFGMWMQPSTVPRFFVTKRENSVETLFTGAGEFYIGVYGTTYIIILTRSGKNITMEVWDSTETTRLLTVTKTIALAPYTNFKVSDYDGNQAAGYTSTGWIDSLVIMKLIRHVPHMGRSVRASAGTGDSGRRSRVRLYPTLRM